MTLNFPNSIAVPATTIDDVIQQLTAIVEWSKQNNARMGYFAALYRKVTIQVKKGIQENYFDNGPRMERLDVIFANRYIQACYQYQTGQTPTQSWVRAFNATQHWWPIVLQHLLLGMNAHINLDLGIAAAETVAPEDYRISRAILKKSIKFWHPSSAMFNKNGGNLAITWVAESFLGQHRNSIDQFQHGESARCSMVFCREVIPAERATATSCYC